MTRLPSSDTAYLDQTAALVAEVNSSRLQIESLTSINEMLKSQHDDLAARHATALKNHDAELTEMKAHHDRVLHDAITAKNVAERKRADTKAVLDLVANHIMQALRAEKGDETPPANDGKPAELRPHLRVLLDETRAG